MNLAKINFKRIKENMVTVKYFNWFKDKQIKRNIIFSNYKSINDLRLYVRNLNKNRDYLYGIFFENTHIGNIKFEKPLIENKKEPVSFMGILIGNKLFRGKGYTHLIIEKAMIFFEKKFLIKKYKLGVSTRNFSAINCYKNSGFRIIKKDSERFLMERNAQILNLSKISLGTAQVGLDYGINNSKGMMNSKNLKAIINYSNLMGIRNIDTAFSYGESESKLGNVGVKNFKITSKVPHVFSSQKNHIKKFLMTSLKRLKIKKLECLMIHDPYTLKNKGNLMKIFNEMLKLKSINLIQKIGVSITDFSDLDFLIKNSPVDVIQVPFNILDQRIKKKFFLEKLEKKNIEIEVRSVFLQGLLFKKKSDIKKMFKKSKYNWDKLNFFFKYDKFSKFSYMLNYVYDQKFIKRIVVGFDDVRQLTQLGRVKRFEKKITRRFSCNDEKILNPHLWSNQIL
tara:strand:- start:9459 stop:10814 length:1356 start_codon:yes stop_codon:yes gene_type:complete